MSSNSKLSLPKGLKAPAKRPMKLYTRIVLFFTIAFSALLVVAFFMVFLFSQQIIQNENRQNLLRFNSYLTNVIDENKDAILAMDAGDRLTFISQKVYPYVKDNALIAYKLSDNQGGHYATSAILDDIPVSREFVSQKEAVAKGAMALFGEKYGETVCLVEVPGVSMELCGGTHLSSTGQAGSFVILSETGVAAGIRRIEAATGWNALNYFQGLRQEMGEVQAVLKARPDDVAARAKAMSAQVKSLQKDVERLQTKLASGEGGAHMREVEDIGGVKVLAVKAEAASMKSLREQMDALKSKLPSGVAMLAAPTEDGKVAVLVAVSKDLHTKFTAPQLIKEVAAEVGGSGGGRPDMAQAGGTDPSGIDRAIAKLKELVGKA